MTKGVEAVIGVLSNRLNMHESAFEITSVQFLPTEEGDDSRGIIHYNGLIATSDIARRNLSGKIEYYAGDESTGYSPTYNLLYAQAGDYLHRYFLAGFLQTALGIQNDGGWRCEAVSYRNDGKTMHIRYSTEKTMLAVEFVVSFDHDENDPDGDCSNRYYIQKSIYLSFNPRGSELIRTLNSLKSIGYTIEADSEGEGFLLFRESFPDSPISISKREVDTLVTLAGIVSPEVAIHYAKTTHHFI